MFGKVRASQARQPESGPGGSVRSMEEQTGRERRQLIRDFERSGRLLHIFARTGRESTFVRLHGIVKPWLRRQAALKTRGSGIDPDELVAAVLTSLFLFSSRFRYQGGEAFRGWMLAVVKSSLVRQIRFRNRAGTSLESVAEPCDNSRGDPLRILLTREKLEAALRSRFLILLLCSQGVENITREERMALDLNLRFTIDREEIAERLGKSSSQARGLIRRAREKIARHLIRTLAFPGSGPNP